MGFEFAETMAGSMEMDDRPGVKRPFRFEVRAHAGSIREHMVNGRATLHGIVHAPPLAEAADAEGIITIRPLVQRIIRYELSFVGDDGRGYELVGQKDIRWLSPIKTFTTLPAEILDEDGRRVATCLTTFDLWGEGVGFLRSFRLA